jgi:hypothetical protein
MGSPSLWSVPPFLLFGTPPKAINNARRVQEGAVPRAPSLIGCPLFPPLAVSPSGRLFHSSPKKRRWQRALASSPKALATSAWRLRLLSPAGQLGRNLHAPCACVWPSPLAISSHPLWPYPPIPLARVPWTFILPPPRAINIAGASKSGTFQDLLGLVTTDVRSKF